MFLIEDAYWQIKKTKEKGRGVFAKKKIESGTLIGDYLGKIIHIAHYDIDHDKNGLYLMSFTDHAFIYPDLEKPGIHLLNHSCKPNCWIYTHRGHTLFFALRDINPKEELTISYLLSPKDETCNPCVHACRCGSKYCTGTMHTSKDKYKIWQRFQNKEKKKTKTVSFIFGKNLNKLSFYPKIDIHEPIYTVMCSSSGEY